MVVDSITAVTNQLGEFFGIGGTGAIYLLALLLSLYFTIYSIKATGNKKIGGAIFVIAIFGFSFLGMFPLWIIAVVLIMAVAIILKMGGNE